MYSPKVPERLIPILYRLGRERGRPMTHLVAEAVERYLEDAGRLGEAVAEARTSKVVHLRGDERHAA
jgi:predicted DNA-binding protein